ncbi:MAG: AAA family ATPase, partial [Desulfobacteraceae bacterium]|nr:AAA family ATPase [Desulfobacteraceae bacterium]
FCGGCGYDLRESQGTSEINHTEPQSYTPKHLADKILISRSSIEGERKLVTVLFADVANYTSISEKLDPEEVHQIMDGCFKILMNEIHQYEGTINQFTGDGVMALFGAPVSHEDHAQRACRAAITIQSALGKYEKDLEQRYDIRFKMRIGINSGLVVVGSIGDDLRMDYTAIGDTTNLAARMEGIAEPGSIVMTQNTRKLVKNFFELKSLGEIKIKGKDELQKAFQLIKSGDVETRIGASIAKGLTRFVGRKKLMGTLTEVFEKVKSGSGQIIGIVGEAGVGKSRLLLEIRNTLPQNEFEYLEGRCHQYGGSILYLPVLDILRSIFNIKDNDKEHIVKRKINDVIINLDENFSRLNPSFQDILSLKIDDEEFVKLDPKGKREKIFEAIRDLLIRISQEKPLVIAVEDLHWIDKTSEEFLSYFIDWLANTQILLIFLYRPEYTHQWGSKSFYTKIGVDQLGMSSSGELVKAILEEGEVAPELRQLILNRSAGNPLFIEEFIHTLVENGSIEKKEDQYALIGNPENIKVPDTIQGIIAARLDRLEDNLKRTMQVASVIGRDFAFRILQTIIGMKNELKSNLLNLQGLEFIYEKNLFPELEYIFKHALTQEVAYNSLLQKRRKEIHKKIGEAIEELYPERLEEFYEMLAYHYCKSNSIDKAIYYSKLSALKAVNSYSHWGAYKFYKEVYNALRLKPDSLENKREKYEILLSMLTPLAMLGLPDKSLWTIEKRIELAKDIGDGELISQSYISIATYFTHRGKNDMAIQYTESAFREAKKSQHIELMVQSACTLCVAYNSIGEPSKICAIIPEVISLIEKKKKTFDFFSYPMLPFSLLTAFCGLAMEKLGNVKTGEEFLQKGFNNAQKTDDPIGLASIECIFGIFFSQKGDFKSAKKHLEPGIKLAKKINYTWLEAFCWCCLGYVNVMDGNIKIGKNYAQKGLKLHLESGIEMSLTHSYYLSGMVCYETGDWEAALNYWENALTISQKNNEKENQGRILFEIGRVTNKIKPEFKNKAHDYIVKGIKILKELELKPFLAQAHLALGNFYLDNSETQKAVNNLQTAESLFQEIGMFFWLDRTQNLLCKIKV